MRNKSLILLSLATATLLLIHGAVIAQERLTSPILIQPNPTFSFGMIGIGTGQTGTPQRCEFGADGAAHRHFRFPALQSGIGSLRWSGKVD